MARNLIKLTLAAILCAVGGLNLAYRPLMQKAYASIPCEGSPPGPDCGCCEDCGCWHCN